MHSDAVDEPLEASYAAKMVHRSTPYFVHPLGIQKYSFTEGKSLLDRIYRFCLRFTPLCPIVPRPRSPLPATPRPPGRFRNRSLLPARTFDSLGEGMRARLCFGRALPCSLLRGERVVLPLAIDPSTSTRTRRPPEFKHITKGRKRK